LVAVRAVGGFGAGARTVRPSAGYAGLLVALLAGRAVAPRRTRARAGIAGAARRALMVCARLADVAVARLRALERGSCVCGRSRAVARLALRAPRTLRARRAGLFTTARRTHRPACAVLVAGTGHGCGGGHGRAAVSVALEAPGVVAGVSAAAPGPAAAPHDGPERRGRQRHCGKTARCRKPRKIHRCLRGAFPCPSRIHAACHTPRALAHVRFPGNLRRRTWSPSTRCDQTGGLGCERALIVCRAGPEPLAPLTGPAHLTTWTSA
jgi:hypothetical protein